MNSIWFFWVFFMFLVVLPPVGYGWGYRGWGPPLPRYMQHRRSQHAASSQSNVQFDHHAWGRGGDVVWGVLVIWVIWACVALWWR